MVVENKTGDATHLTTPQMVVVEDINEHSLPSKSSQAPLHGGIAKDRSAKFAQVGAPAYEQLFHASLLDIWGRSGVPCGWLRGG